jgi:type I restriction enzyme S subunit
MSKVEVEFDPLYRLPDGWEWHSLEELIKEPKQDIVDGPFGSNLKASEYTSEGIPVARLQNIDRNQFVQKNINYVTRKKADELKRHTFGPGDILITKLGDPLGKACIAPHTIEHGVIVADLVRVRIDHQEIDRHYLTYAINSPFVARQFEKHTKGTTRPRVNLGMIRQLPIPVAPKAQQKRIVAEIEKQFSRLDEAVANLKRVKANLKRYKAAVLKAAVEGKLTEDWRKAHPDVEAASELLKRILAERRAKWNGKGKYKEPAAPDTADLPSLPEGWIWVRWDQIALSQNGRAFPSKEYQAQGFKLLRPGNLHVSGKVVWNEENSRYLPECWATEFPEFIVGPHELIMNLTAQSLKDEFLGRVCLTGPEERCLLNQRLARLTPVEVLPEFLLWVFKSRVFRRFVDDLNTGSLIQHMFTSQLGDFVLPLPPLPEQQQIIAEVERRLSVIEEIEAMAFINFQRAERLKQSILQQAFAGQFRLSTWR